MELGWVSMEPLFPSIFNFGVGTNSEETHIYTFGGRGAASNTLSKSIKRYNRNLDEWSSLATRLPTRSHVATSRSLNGILWLLLNSARPKLVNRFDADAETLEVLSIANIPTCKS